MCTAATGVLPVGHLTCRGLYKNKRLSNTINTTHTRGRCILRGHMYDMYIYIYVGGFGWVVRFGLRFSVASPVPLEPWCPTSPFLSGPPCPRGFALQTCGRSLALEGRPPHTKQATGRFHPPTPTHDPLKLQISPRAFD